MVKWIQIFETKEKALVNLKDNIPFTVSINNLKICILKTYSGITASKMLCPHSGASLAEGFVNQENEIVCPLHGYRFSLRDGREKSGHNCGLYMYGIELREDGLFLALR